MCAGGGAGLGTLVCFFKDQGPTLTTLSNPNYLPKAPFQIPLLGRAGGAGRWLKLQHVNLKWLKLTKKLLDGFGKGPTPKYLGESSGGAGSGKQMKMWFLCRYIFPTMIPSSARNGQKIGY